MKGFGNDRSTAARADLGLDEDAVLQLLQWLAERDLVATLFTPTREDPVHQPLWEFRVFRGPASPADLRQSVVTEGTTIGACIRVALPRLQAAGLPLAGTPWEAGPGQESVIEGTGALLLDWLADTGMSVFLKADGERPGPGWTFLTKDGPLPTMLRTDGTRVTRCFHDMLSQLRVQGLAIPI